MIYNPQKPVSVNDSHVLLHPMDIDLSNRIIALTGRIDEEKATFVNSALRCLVRESHDPITLYINSPGGEVSAGFSIFDTLKASGCEINTVACGMAASMGAFLLSAGGTKGHRYAQPNAEILLHQPLGGTSGQAADIKIYAEHILILRKRINRILSECTGQALKKIEKDTDRDNIMSASAALEYGLVDIIADPISEW